MSSTFMGTETLIGMLSQHLFCVFYISCVLSLIMYNIVYNCITKCERPIWRVRVRSSSMSFFEHFLLAKFVKMKEEP